MMKRTDWEAKWIWRDIVAKPNEFLLFRKVIKINYTFKEAYFYITAESNYVLYINGKYVHRGTSFSYPNQQIYDEINISHLLRKGENVIGIVVNYFGIPSGNSLPKEAGLCAELEIIDNKGNLNKIMTDSTWKNTIATEWKQDVPTRSFWRNLEYIEVRDFRKKIEGWNKLKFDDSNWRYSYEKRKAPYGEWGVFELRDKKQLIRKKILPQSILRTGFVENFLPNDINNFPIFNFKITETYSKDANVKILLSTYIKALRNQKARIIVETSEDCEYSLNNEPYEKCRRIESVRVAEIFLKKGKNKLEIRTFLKPIISMIIRNVNIYFTVVPLQRPYKLGFYSDRFMKKLGWNVLCRGKEEVVSNCKNIVDHLNPAKLIEYEDIIDYDIPGSKNLISNKEIVLPPLSLNKAYTILIDVGKEVTGYVILNAKGAEGTIIDIGYAEDIVNGRINPAYSDVYYADRYILSNKKCLIEPIEWKGFRYVQITIRNCKKRTSLKLHIDFLQYPFVEKGKFVCSDDLLNRIRDTAVYGAMLCMMETPIDCPWREKRQWLGDSANIMQANNYAFGAYEYHRSALRQQFFLLDISGRLWVCVPLFEELPFQSMDWGLSMWDYFQHSGDKTLFKELMPKIDLYVKWFLQNTNKKSGLFSNYAPGTWQWVDGPVSAIYGKKKKDIICAMNAKYYYFLLKMAKFYRIMEQKQIALKLETVAKKVKIGINKIFWNKEKELFNDVDNNNDLNTEIANGAVLAFDVTSKERAKKVLNNMFKKNNLGIEASPYFKYYVYRGLFKYGYGKYVLDDIRRKWGDMLSQGATTFWENFKRGDSRCHGWSGYLARIMAEEILGVKIVETKEGGFSKVKIEPKCYDIEWAKGEVPTPKGNIKVSWIAKGGKIIKLSYKIPKGIEVVGRYKKYN